MHQSFSIAEALRFGWKKTRAHSGLVFKVLLTLFGVQIAHSIVNETLMPSLEGIFATVILTIVSVVVGSGATLISLKLARGTHAHYADIIPPIDVVVRYFFASLLAGIVILLGLILLIIPGIYFMLRYSMVRLVALESEGIIEALKMSGRLTEGIKWKLLLFILTLAAINVLGALALFVGLLITIPVSMIAYAHVYQTLRHRIESKS